MRGYFILLLLIIHLPLHAETVSPNIIFMMADDMGMGDTSAFQDFTGNSDEVQLYTPNMERLARMGVRFTDAHTPSSRCTTTRYGLLTGRYSWRSRMKWWVLFGSQGDPLIEADRPTIATLLRDNGYVTGMVGKWHVGLRYRRSDGKPAAGWNDADLSKLLHTTPLDHGFDYARFTSRSHGTSGPNAGNPNAKRRNGPKQKIGPGHIHGRTAVSATGDGKQLVGDGPEAYVLSKLGSRHSNHAFEFLEGHVAGANRQRPFFLYYPSNSNHGPYTPDKAIGGKPVAGAARTKSGATMDRRHDYIYENDVALGRMLDWLEATDDSRNAGKKLIANTLVVFTSDNGAEKGSKTATGPFRSNKGSCYEGGHRVPFIVSWTDGGVGDGDAVTPGQSNATPIGLQDMYATFAEIIEAGLPDLRRGKKGAEDSFSVLAALRGILISKRPPLFFNDHKEARSDPAVAAMRLDSPTVGGKKFEGKWKLFFDASLLRSGETRPYELYNLTDDPKETENLIGNEALKPLVTFLASEAKLHRRAGGHRLAEFAPSSRVVFDWRSKEGEESALCKDFAGRSASGYSVIDQDSKLTMTIQGASGQKLLGNAEFSPNFRGLGLTGGESNQVENSQALLVKFDRDVLVESAAIVAGNGQCGGFYRIGGASPLAIYCVDADNDAQNQQGILCETLAFSEKVRLCGWTAAPTTASSHRANGV